MTTLEHVAEFHRVFERPINDHPYIVDTHTNKLRVKLLREEVDELDEALTSGTEEDVLDALTDIQYILDGSYLSLGFWRIKDKAFKIVHEANMRKLGPNNLPMIREDGKILKPLGWVPPNLKLVIETLR